MMYASGISLQAIAEKFNRSTASIQKLISNMGVHRGDNVIDQEQEQAPNVDKPTERKETSLKKPWYLKSQTQMRKD